MNMTFRSGILLQAVRLALFVSLFALAPSACSKAKAPAPGGLSVRVDASGYHPSEIHAPAGKKVKINFLRTSDEGCGQQLVFPSMDLRKDLPLNENVVVELTMPASGKVEFTCGMAMYKGAIVAHP